MANATQAKEKVHHRWHIAIMGTILQLGLGTVYAWSFFQKPLVNTYGWSNTQVSLAFSIAICFLGFAAAWGGINLPKFGPRKLATIGAVMYGVGYIIGGIALSLKNLPLLYLGFGAIGGAGMGLGYVTPVATVAKWFPDKKGFVTGMVIMGFGLGALIMSKIIAPLLLSATDGNLVSVFIFIGLVLLAFTVPAGLVLHNPPQGFAPKGYHGTAKAQQDIHDDSHLTPKACIFSRKFFMMWFIFFCNITAGIMFIGFQSPMLQEIIKSAKPLTDPHVLATTGATLIAISSLFNGLGRFFWGGISDHLGRVQTFRVLLITQILVFLSLIFVKNSMLFSILVCYVLFCYGGGFGSMPSFVLDIFGPRMMAVVYGTILTAWSMGGVVGPQIVAFLKDNFNSQASVYSFAIGALLLTIGAIISFFLSNERFSEMKSAKL